MKHLLFTVICLAARFAWGQSSPPKITSNLEVLDIKSGKRQIIQTGTSFIESPHWSRDGQYFVINRKGTLEKISLKGELLGIFNTDWVSRCNNAHGTSYDGKTLFFSQNDANPGAGNNSRIFKVAIEGGTPTLLTEKAPSFWCGVSRSGKNILYSAQRNGEWDIYKLPTAGGEELRLTNASGLDDAPEYSPDSRFIYFSSHRTGRVHLYRMKPDGTEQEQLTNDEFDNWYAHPSPDGNWIVYLAYLEDQQGEHPFGKEVKLRLMNTKTKQIKDLTKTFVGGHGTLNSPCWSPDSKRIVFVSYQMD